MFTLVAERINCSRKAIREATEQRDSTFIQQEAVKQADAGATYIDINAGVHPDTELENMQWLISQVLPVTTLPICVDSANPSVVQAGLATLDGRPALINSVSLEPGRLATLLPLAQQYNAGIVALCLGETGLPNSAQQRLTLATQLIEQTRVAGIADHRVFIDPLVRVIAAEPEQGAAFLHAIRLIHAAFPAVHFCAGVSNISFGLPRRSLINRTLLTLAIWEGLDGAILDVTDTDVMAQLYATRVITGQDECGIDYVSVIRENLLQ